MGYAIVTRYIGPTNYRGSRVIATGPALRTDDQPLRRTVSWDYAEDRYANHRRAARAVVEALRADGWRVELPDSPATLPDDSGMVWPLTYDRNR